MVNKLIFRTNLNSFEQKAVIMSCSVLVAVEGAVPKDGPSAGITMATAMLSAITDRAVRADVAMTGEITLRGRVLPIGGLKEKLLAAKVIGIKTVCIPKDNEKDLEEISKEITDGMEIVPVERFSQVEKIAFVK